MNQLSSRLKPINLLLFFGLFITSVFIFPEHCYGKYPILKKLIINYNKSIQQKYTGDKFYRGEEGILRIKPEAAQSIGMKVYIDEDYLDAKKLFTNAEKALGLAEEAMRSQKPKAAPDQFVKEILKQILIHKESIALSKQKFEIYRSKIKPVSDERLNSSISQMKLEELLDKSLENTNQNLREALGYYYNFCLEDDVAPYQLTTENIRFVNEIFVNFTKQAPKPILDSYDLDKNYRIDQKTLLNNWKRIVDKKFSQHVTILEGVVKKYNNDKYPVNPLLFSALIKRESSFNPRSVSGVGAVGLTQIMPKTGKGLGMKNIYEPDYFNRAFEIMKEERGYKRRAMDLLFSIDSKKMVETAKKSRDLMQKSLALQKKRNKLFSQYKKELLIKQNDDRLQPNHSILFGYKYFSNLMKKQKGDISLALASYNAGPHRVHQYKGIPPYEETVVFRNRVLNYYRSYLKALSKYK